MYKILFICTDNIGRSLTAEYLLRDYLAKNNREDIAVASAGIDAGSDIGSYSMKHRDILKEKGIDTARHERRQVTGELLAEYDLSIAMELEQQEWIRSTLGAETFLYNELTRGERSSYYISPKGLAGTMEEKLEKMVEYFEETLPELVKATDNF